MDSMSANAVACVVVGSCDVSITFAPRRGAILMCDFGPDPIARTTFPLHQPPVSVGPEVWKIRRVVVVSPDALNHRHGRGPGLCVVVPFSATPPRTPGPQDVFFAARSYRSLTADVWAACGSPIRVSHARLDRVKAGQVFRSDMLSAFDMDRVDAGLRTGLGL